MKTRIISGACFVAIITGFILLGRYVNINLLSILLWFVCSVGTFEVARAVDKYTSNISNKCYAKNEDDKKTIKDYFKNPIFCTELAFGFLTIPSYYFFNIFFSVKLSIIFSLLFILLGIVVILDEVVLLSKDGGSFKNIGIAILPIVYPSILILIMFLPIIMYSGLSLQVFILSFVIPALCDTFAYFVGILWQKIKKGQAKKLCPKISPKKTVAGAIGGLIGGTIGALLIFFIFIKFSLKSFALYSIIGIIASIATEIGDLVESLIKRKVGIKDMGNIMPGHGGVMDRFDGITFAGAAIFLIVYILRHV